MSEFLECDVCQSEEAEFVGAVPGIPMSVRYGPKCLEHNAHPWRALRGEIVYSGGPSQFDQTYLNSRITYIDGKYMSISEALAINPVTDTEVAEYEDEDRRRRLLKHNQR